MVWRTLLFLFFAFPLFGSDLAERQNFWTFEAIEPSSIHLGFVNAITGDYLESTCDIQVRSVAPLSFRRHLCSSDPTPYSYGVGWSIHELNATWDNQRPHPSGEPNPSECWMELAHPDYGSLNYLPANKPLRWAVQYFKTLSNTGSGEISGRTNLKNIRVVYKNHPHYEMFRGDGEMALYKFDAKEDKSFYRLGRLVGRLIERTLPKGYRLDYEEDSVTAYTPSKEQLLGWIHTSQVDGGLEVTTSDGQSAKLKFDGDRNLRRIEVEGQPWVEYDYCQKKLGDFLNKGVRRPTEKMIMGLSRLRFDRFSQESRATKIPMPTSLWSGGRESVEP